MSTIISEHDIAGHYLPYLVNGDDSGLEPREKEDADWWWNEYNPDGKLILDISEDADFKMCCISDLWGDCYEVALNSVADHYTMSVHEEHGECSIVMGGDDEITELLT